MGHAAHGHGVWVAAELPLLRARRPPSCLTLYGGRPAAMAAVVPAVKAAAALPTAAHLGAVGPTDDGLLGALCDAAAPPVGGVAALELRLHPSTTAAGLGALGGLTGVRRLTLEVPAGVDVGALGLEAWPVGGRSRLTLRPPPAGEGEGGWAPAPVPALLRGLAASASAPTLAWLSLSRPERVEADAARPLTALMALHFFD